MRSVNHLNPLSAILFGAALLIAFTGCGDGRGNRIPVAGSVTIDGEPLKFGSVTFMPKTHGDGMRAGGGSVDGQGRFTVSSFTANDGLLIGSYEVQIKAVEKIDSSSQRWHAPRKYSKVKTSNLKAEITADTTELKFELSWDGEDPSEPFVETF